MTRTAIQLYTLREEDESVPDLLRHVSDAGFDGVEFAYRVRDADREAVRAALEETGLSVVGTHTNLTHLTDDVEETAELFEYLGCEDLVLSFLGEEHFASEEAVVETADLLEQLAIDLGNRGFAFHYHNHDHEFVELGETTALERLVEVTDERVGFELDAGLALRAGIDPVPLIRTLSGRSSLLHLKDVDVDEGGSTPLGEGDLDVEACVEAAEDAGIDWLIYEYEGEDALATVAPTAELLTQLLE